MIYGTGIIGGWVASKPFPRIVYKMLAFHFLSHMAFYTGCVISLVVIPTQRLMGFKDNGLRWRYPDDKLKKYDLTSHYEKATGWDRFRVNLDN